MLSDAQATRLQACARVLHAPGRIVVIGRFTGPAVEVLTGAASEGVEVLAVGADALGAVDGPIDLLYVGAPGRYTQALEALERWGGRVVPSGTLFVQGAFSAPPVTGAMLRFLGTSPAWRYAGREGSLAEYTRAVLTPGERVLDGIVHVAQLPSFARALARRRTARLRSR